MTDEKMKNDSKTNGEENIPDPLPYTMDGTTHIEISGMKNPNYSKELLKVLDKNFKKKLKKARKVKDKQFLVKSKNEINKLIKTYDSLTSHSEMSNVTILVNIGKILNEVEEYLGSKKAYMQWLEDNYDPKKMRQLQHAKELAKIEYAQKYPSLGKNRILELERASKSAGKKDIDEFINDPSFNSIFSDTESIDTTKDFDQKLHKIRLDAVVTLERFKKSNIEWVSNSQALYIAAILGNSITFTQIGKIINYLNNHNNERDKIKAFNNYLLNKLVFPSDNEVKKSQESFMSLLIKIDKYFRENDIDDNWIKQNKAKLDMNLIQNVFNNFNDIIKQLNTERSQSL